MERMENNLSAGYMVSREHDVPNWFVIELNDNIVVTPLSFKGFKCIKCGTPLGKKTSTRSRDKKFSGLCQNCSIRIAVNHVNKFNTYKMFFTELWKDNVSIEDMQKIIGVKSNTTLYRWRKKLGLKPRHERRCNVAVEPLIWGKNVYKKYCVGCGKPLRRKGKNADRGNRCLTCNGKLKAEKLAKSNKNKCLKKFKVNKEKFKEMYFSTACRRKDILKEFHIAPETFYKWAKKLGLPQRKRWNKNE